ncbi:MAG: histidine kinase [Clostridiales Family XIII bacterium]|jgi:signal transduction histidine kinase|nr:histidine kinase [Clostridiales Family XIII bacterium]
MKQSQHDQALFFYFVSVAAAVICFVLSAPFSALRFEYRIVAMLAVAVLASASLFARLIPLPAPAGYICAVCACAGVVVFEPAGALPMVAATAVAVLAGVIRSAAALALAASAVMALYYIIIILFHAIPVPWTALDAAQYAAQDAALSPPTIAPWTALAATLIISALIAGFSVYIVWILKKRERELRRLDERGDRIENLNATIASQSRSARAMEHISKLTERNRLAARIHDEVGHGMSGSILLLEGANAIMESDPAAARDAVRRATEHLRDSTDKIRAMLRDERTESPELSLARIRSELAAFESEHPSVRTSFDVDTGTDSVAGAIWNCIRENMVEAMTNTLKHSNATRFSVTVATNRKLLRAEFADNGSAGSANGSGHRGGGAAGGSASGSMGGGGNSNANGAPSARPFDGARNGGMGLRGMEERCALCYGRCFFRHDADGFHIVMTFPLGAIGAAEQDDCKGER